MNQTIEQLTQTLREALPGAQTASERCRIQAAICALDGDLQGVEQDLLASKIPQAEWDAAKSGKLDY